MSETESVRESGSISTEGVNFLHPSSQDFVFKISVQILTKNVFAFKSSKREF